MQMGSKKYEHDRRDAYTAARCFGASPYLSLERIEKMKIKIDNEDHQVQYVLELSIKNVCRLIGLIARLP